MKKMLPKWGKFLPIRVDHISEGSKKQIGRNLAELTPLNVYWFPMLLIININNFTKEIITYRNRTVI